MARLAKQRHSQKQKTQLLILEKKEAEFLEALAETGNEKHSSELAKLPRQHIRRRMRESTDFAAAHDEALQLGLDACEDEANRRAVIGVLEPVFYKGRMTRHRVRKYSDLLLMFILKAHRPAKYREKYDVTSLNLTSQDVNDNARERIASRIAGIASRTGADPK